MDRRQGFRVNRTLEVVTLGEPLVLLLAEAGIPLANAQIFRRQAIGAELNVATGLARMGHCVALAARVGNDQLGTALLGAIRYEGIDTTMVHRDPAPTGLIVRDCPSARPVDVAYYRTDSAGAQLCPEDLDPSLIGSARVLHLTGITPMLSATCAATVEAAVASGGAAGADICVDPNLRRRLGTLEQARAALSPALAAATIILAGTDEGQALTGLEDRSRVADHWLSEGARIVVLKEGPAGSWVYDGNTATPIPATPVPTVDPVGAGDAYAAGFLSGLLRGDDPAGAARLGAAVAALVVATPGDREGLPTSAPPPGFAADVHR